MKNADMPAMPQERDWQNDMEAHVANPKSGVPPLEGAGLTKREYFAAMAMSGYCSESAGWDESAQEVARCSVAMADALLDKLEKAK